MKSLFPRENIGMSSRYQANSNRESREFRRKSSVLAAALALSALPSAILAQTNYGSVSNGSVGTPAPYRSGESYRSPASGDLAASPWSRHSSATNSSVPIGQASYARGAEPSQVPDEWNSGAIAQPATVHWGALQAIPNSKFGSAPLPRPDQVRSPIVKDLETSSRQEASTRTARMRSVSNPTEISLAPPFQLPTLGSTPSSEQVDAPKFLPLTSESSSQMYPSTAWSSGVASNANTPDPRWLAEQEREAARREIAQRVSDNILSTQPPPMAAPPRPLERPAGWQSVEQELKSNMSHCDQLLRRGAVHSARSEVVSGLKRLSRTIDSFAGQYRSEPALHSALTALKEESDFQRVSPTNTIEAIVATHTTAALQGRPLERVSPEIASQHYRQFACYQFIQAAEQHPWAADLLYGLGKTYEKEADIDVSSAIRLRSQAAICYQAALQIRSNHADAGSQLGYVLTKLDRLEDARLVLLQTVQRTPTAAAWANLAELHRRMGNSQQADYAVAQATQLGAGNQVAFTEQNPQVVQVDPSEFARYSPALNVASPSMVANANATQTTTLPVAAPVQAATNQSASPQTASRAGGFLSNLFR